MAIGYIDQNGSIQFLWFCGSKKNRGVCGAKTRKGAHCQAPPAWDKSQNRARNGRCKLHGGLSTGPKTEAGRDAIRASNRGRSKNYKLNPKQ